jgi:hypothetical protein
VPTSTHKVTTLTALVALEILQNLGITGLLHAKIQLKVVRERLASGIPLCGIDIVKLGLGNIRSRLYEDA